MWFFVFLLTCCFKKKLCDSHLLAAVFCLALLSPAPDLRPDGFDLIFQGQQLVEGEGWDRGGDDGSESQQDDQPGQPSFDGPAMSPSFPHETSREPHACTMAGFTIEHGRLVSVAVARARLRCPCECSTDFLNSDFRPLSSRSWLRSEELRRTIIVQESATASPLSFHSTNRTAASSFGRSLAEIFLP